MDNDEDSSQDLLHKSHVAGLVVRIVLKNFMCHDHLKVDFNRHINFICGKNGSGKSAILAALVIALGGKASETNRASNLKNLIKSGQSQATIEVTLTNVGAKAFKPDIYGDEIIITRTINETLSVYKINRRHGKPLICKRTELNELLDCFKIQINNPISVLNQDMAKSFIKTSNPKDLYKFFINGTLLNEVEEALNDLSQYTLPQLQKTLNDKKDELNFVNKDLDAIKKKHERKKQLIQLEKEYSQLQAEYNWAQVHASQNEIEKSEKRLEEVQKVIRVLEQKIQNKGDLENELLTKRDAVRRELKELTKERDENMTISMEAERNYNRVVNRYEELHHEKKSLEKKLKNQQSGFDQADQRLKLLQNQNAEAAAKRLLIEEKRKGLQAKIHELKTVINTNNNHIQNLNASLQKKSEELAMCNAASHQSLSNIGKIKHRLKELQSNSSELTCFGDYVPQLVEEINAAHKKGKFIHKPVGPLGHFIKLNKASEWRETSFGPVIETIIGRGLLCAFVVDSNKDYDVMKAIFSQLRIHNTPQLIISQFIDKTYDVSKHKVRHPKFPSMFDALDFSSPIVANTIIDQVSVENVLLVPTNEDAYALMEDVSTVPSKCDKAVTLNTLFYPAPNYRSYSLNCKKNTTMLQVNKDSLIRDLKESLNKLERDDKDRRLKLNSVKEDEADIRSSLVKAEEENRKIRKEMASSEMELLGLSNEEDNISLEQESLKEDITYRKKAINDLKKQLQKLSGSLDQMSSELEETKKKKESTSYIHFDEEINKYQESLAEIESSYHELTANSEKFMSQKNDQEIIRNKIESSIGTLKLELASKEQEAKQSGVVLERESCRSINMLKDRMSEVKNEINVLKDFIGDGSIEDITADLQNQIEKVEAINKIICETQDEARGTKEMIKDLAVEFETLRIDKSKKIKANFRNITQLKNYKEELIFDHGARKLSIIVKTDVKGQQTTSVLSLSGGERSFSMVAFILALWQEMALPFYFLDEFDVFMDPVNRDLIIKLLVMYARINTNHQFVFFTPNDFKIDGSSNVGIFRMVDPRDDHFSQL